MTQVAYLIWTTATTTGILLLALFVLIGSRRQPLTGQRVLGAALAASIATFFATLIGIFETDSMFPMIQHGFLLAAVVIPILGLSVFALRRSGRLIAPGARNLALLFVLPVPFAVWARFIEPHRLVTEHVAIALTEDRVGTAPLIVAVLADLQTDVIGDHERDAVRRALDAKPDLIVLPGDVFQGFENEFERELPALRELLTSLASGAPHGAFLVKGDCDPDPWMQRFLEGTGVRLLDNEIVLLTIKDRRVTLGGLRIHSGDAGLALIRDLEDRPGRDDVRLLVAHRPGNITALSPHSRIDLTIAGHTHGGQVVIPGLGPPITLSPLPRHVAAGGLHTLEGRRLYLSRGVGCERQYAPPIRFWCPPEVTVLTLQ